MAGLQLGYCHHIHANTAEQIKATYSTHLKFNKLYFFQMQKLLNPSLSDKTNVRSIKDRYAHVMKRLSAARFMSYVLTVIHCYTWRIFLMDYFSNILLSLKRVTSTNVGDLFQACLQSYRMYVLWSDDIQKLLLHILFHI